MKKSVIITKKHIILSVLVFALAAAVYLNWQLSDPKVDNTQDDDSSYLGTAEYVNADVKVDKDYNVDYFTETRTSRENSRKNRVDVLNGIIDNAKSSADEIKNSKEELKNISKLNELEINIESLVKAKGFDDCVAIINEDKITLVIPSTGLMASQTMQIQDIVSSQTGFLLENIKIIEIN